MSIVFFIGLVISFLGVFTILQRSIGPGAIVTACGIYLMSQ